MKRVLSRSAINDELKDTQKKRLRINPNPKQLIILLIFLLVTVGILVVYHNFHNLFQKQKNTVSLHIPTFSSKDTKKLFISDDFNDFDRIRKEIDTINGTHHFFDEYRESYNKRDAFFNIEKWRECVNDDSNFFRFYLDLSCYKLWLYQLEYNNVINIDNIEGVMKYADERLLPKEERRFKSMSNGGVRMHFNPHSDILMSANFNKGYWKPCTLDTGHFESYLAEIVSFWIDRVIGFYHTPPVVPRYFSRVQLLSLAAISEHSKEKIGDRMAIEKIESILNVCGTKESELSSYNQTEGVEGAMVGWSPFPLRVVSSKRADNFVLFSTIETQEQFDAMKQKFFTFTPNTTIAERFRAIEIISVHLYAMIVGNLHKFDHNLFLAYHEKTFLNGPFVYIDNDRSQWLASAYKLTKKQKFNVLRNLCLFPTRIARNILLLRAENLENNGGKTLSYFIKLLARSHHLKNEPIFTAQDTIILEMNIGYIADMIDDCVSRFGTSVFINEPWPDPYESATN